MKNRDKYMDPCGAELTPGEPERCEGNGTHPAYECCCDECDYYLTCFPDALDEHVPRVV